MMAVFAASAVHGPYYDSSTAVPVVQSTKNAPPQERFTLDLLNRAQRAVDSAKEHVARAVMPIPSLGISVSTAAENRGAEIVDITAGGVADLGGLHRADVITSVNRKQVNTPMELAAALNGLSGDVALGYIFQTETGWWIGKETVVILGGTH